MWKEKSSIQTNLLRTTLFIVLTSIGVWSLIWIQGEYSAFNVEVESIRKDYVDSRKEELKREVSNAVEYIGSIREQYSQRYKGRIKDRVTQAHQIASNIYRKNTAVKSPDEIGRMIKDALRAVRFDDGRSCYFIALMDGTLLMSPTTPDLEGQNVDGSREAIGYIQEAGEGFVHNAWILPGKRPGVHVEQSTFIKYFKPMNWYLSTTGYSESFEEQVQTEVLSRLVKLRFGEDGHFFATTFDGDPLFSKGKIAKNSGNISGLTDSDGANIFQKQLSAGGNPEGGFVYSLGEKRKNSTAKPELIFVKELPEWRWVVGAGVSLDTIEKTISAKRVALYEALKNRINRCFWALLIICLIICVWLKWLSGQIHKNIETFLSFLRRASSDSITIDPDALKLKEFKAIALSTNNMLKERKQAEEALSESVETYRNLFQNAQVGMFRMRIKDGKILESNEQLARMFGYTNRDDFIAEYVTLKNYVFPGTQERILKEIKSKGKIENIEIRFYRKDRTMFWVRFSARMFPDKGWIEGVAEDITEQKLTEEALRKSESQYRLLADNATDNIWILQLSDMRMLYSSPSVERLVGYTSEELVEMHLSDYVDQDSMDIILEALSVELAREGDETADLNRSVVLEMQLIKKDQSKIWVEIKGTFLRDKDGSVDRVLGITREIAERKVAEEEKILAQKVAAEHEKLALVGQIAGKMAHDFNNILGVIMGNVEISLLDCKEDETRKTLQLIFEQTIRGKNLTKNLVVFAKDQEPRHEFFRMSEKIDLVVDLLKKDLSGIELVRDYAETLPEALADPGMIEHALVNLMHNAIHALSLVEEPRIILRTYCNDDNLYFEIEDNGCGIPEEYLDNVYAPAFTLKGNRDVTGSYKSGIKGTGYGLANVKKYINQHKGDVAVVTEFGSGTKFIISLPVVKKELTGVEKAEILTENLHCNKRILLVEDEISISNVQNKILTDDPFYHTVDVAGSGQVAMDLYDRNDYDLISLDYILPGKINGMDVYHHIRSSATTVPVLFISGNIEFLESIRELKQKDLYTDHLSKPCRNKDYVNSLNRLLDRAARDGSSTQNLKMVSRI